MSKVPPPVLGFNNNVRHRGRIFHIQTEDSGVRFARVVTHLFADGGRIMKTLKTEYPEHIERPDVSAYVRQLMKDQHRAMFSALRLGELDAVLERVLGPLAEPSVTLAPAVEKVETVQQEADEAVMSTRPLPARRSEAPRAKESDRPRRRPVSNPNLRGVAPSVAPPSAEAFDLEVAALDQLIPGARPPARPPRKSNPPRKSRPPAAQPRAASPQRPSAQFARAPQPTARSIFGDGAISEQSLDEVILSYLAEDLDGSQE